MRSEASAAATMGVRRKSDSSDALRQARVRKGMTQRELARRTGMHRNSIQKLEYGTTREVSAENAAQLTRVLGASAEELGFKVRRAAPPASIRVRQLTPEQRAILADILALDPEEFEYVRAAIATLREAKRRRGKGRRS